MNTIAILLMQARTEAILVILSLLLGAAIIGYITAWLYFRFTQKSKAAALESSIENHKKQIDQLKMQNNRLENDLTEKSRELDSQKTELKNTVSAQSRIENDSYSMTAINTKNKQTINDQKEELRQIAKRKHLLDYNSFGTATIEEKDDLQMISGIGPFIEERLHAIDIYSFKQISKFTAKDIEKINLAIEYFAGRIERDEWVEQSKELVQDDIKEAALDRLRERNTNIYFERVGIAHKDEADKLTLINGIGSWMEEKLNVLGIFTFRQIANFNNEDVAIVTESIEFSPERIERDEWVSQAKELIKTEGKKDVIINKVQEKKNTISLHRIGVASRHFANNLTRIKGISPWIEEKLNHLDIYTFNQLSKLTNEDISTLSDILGISPKRITRDNWIGQATVLTKALN